MHAAVVELDALPNSIRAGPENDHLGLRRWTNLILILVGAVVIRGLRGEFSGTGIDGLVGGHDTCSLADLAHCGFRLAPEIAQLGIAEAEPLGTLPFTLGQRC